MKGLLKFITCGSVDDGKSTLIGHILYDSKLLYADQEKEMCIRDRYIVNAASGKNTVKVKRIVASLVLCIVLYVFVYGKYIDFLCST